MDKKETMFYPVEKREYKDGIFEAGLVKNSPHKVNKIYLRINDWFFHLRSDEIFSILNVLTNALWCEKLFKMNKTKINWKTLKQITKRINK